ncbi:MAG: hypothetical protein II339_02610, partial [Spirochaetales bacterium]|nr:hypothetical protein [Spirochaetales bacterium]
FDENASNERLNNSETFKSLLDRAKTENEDARKKAEASSRYAKAAAWGNMFHALGQLAGAGKNTYIAPDQTYLKSALSKADEARKMYDAIQVKNRDAESQYRAAYMDNERKAHMESEKLRKSAVDEYNKLLQKDAKDGLEHQLKVAQYELDRMYKMGLLSRKDYEMETARINADANAANAALRGQEFGLKSIIANREYQNSIDKKFNEAYTTYTDSKNGYRYAIDEGLARQISDLMIRQGGYTGKDFGLENKYGTLKEGQITLKDIENNSTFKNAVAKFLNDANQTPEVRAEIDNLLKASFRTEYTPQEFMSAIGNPNFLIELAKSPEMFKQTIQQMKQSSDPAIQAILKEMGINVENEGSSSGTGSAKKDVKGEL